MTNSGSASWRAAPERGARSAPARRWLRGALVALLAAIALAPRPAEAQAESGAPAGFELTHSVQQSLVRIQELWLQWVGASIRDDRSRAEESLRGLIGTVREVGFHRLPDLALGAAAQAKQSAQAGEFERARRQLDAAEILDPGRPETAFAEAYVARQESDWVGALGATLRGFWLTRQVEASRFATASALLWVGYLLLVVAALFVALLAFVHAPDVIHALREKLEPPLPGSVSTVLLVVVLLAPGFLPSGLFWLLLIWSVVLWSFVSPSERAVIVGGWLVAAIVPLVAARYEREIALDQSPPLRALGSFEERRLNGGIFPDLQVLRAALPAHPAVLELVGDVHRTLGQWELARSCYRRVLVDEPGNIPALLNLGAYYFRKGDYSFANAYFTRATQTGTPSAAAWFNLSMGYSAAYLFDESREALTKARQIDSAAVDGWIATENPDRVLTFNGSLARKQELRKALFAVWADPKNGRRTERSDFVRAAAVGAGAPLAALLVTVWLDRPRRRSHSPLHLGPPAVERWLRALLPAIGAAENGAGLWAWANLALLAGLVFLPHLFDLTGDLPVPGWPGPTVLGGIGLLGALVYLGLRVHRTLALERG